MNTLSVVLQLTEELSIDNQNDKIPLLKDGLKSYYRQLELPKSTYHKRIGIILHDILCKNSFETEKQLSLFKEKIRVLEKETCSQEDMVTIDKELFEIGLDWITGSL